MSKSERLLVEVIGDIYDAAMDPTAWESACRRLADLFGATGFAVQINNVETREMPLYVSSGIDPAAAAEYIDEIARTDPRVAFSVGQPFGRPHHDYMFITEQEMSRHPYYDFLARWGFRYYGGGSVLRDGPLVGNASFQRAPAQGPATEADVDLLRRVLPHLGRAVQMGVRLQTLEHRRVAAEQLLESASFGAALLGRRGEVLFLNREARRIVASGEGLQAGVAGVRAARAAENAVLQRLIGGAEAVARGMAIAGGGSMSIRKRTGPHAYAVTVSPVPRRKYFYGTNQPVVMVVITDPDAAPSLSRELLHNAYGLSTAEIEVVSALVAGRTVAQIARERDVTVRTVRTQLETIFRKTGTSRQVELVRLLAGLPPAS